MTADVDELRARVRVLEDREEIRNLLQEYRRTLDVRDMRAFSALFAAQGSWTGRSGAATGPDAIHDMLVAQLPDNPPAPGETLWHWITDPVITVDGDRATASSMWMHVRRGDAARVPARISVRPFNAAACQVSSPAPAATPSISST